MTIELEKIDLLRKRANVSYEDAKIALENSNGDIVEALIYLEKENKIKHVEDDKCKFNFISTLKKIIHKGNVTKFIIKKDESIILNMPVTLLVILTVAMPPITIIGIVLAIITNYKMKFEKQNGEDMQVNKIFDKVSTTVNNIVNE